MSGKASWSNVEDGMRIGLAIKQDHPSSLSLRLCFVNENETMQRIYFLENDFFRSFQSYFTGTDVNGEIMALTLPSPGHGYSVGKKDFPLLEPGSEHCFEQQLSLSHLNVESLTRVAWTYQNQINKWKAGVETFDGLTQQLFNESEYPDLWTGKLEVEVSF